MKMIKMLGRKREIVVPSATMGVGKALVITERILPTGGQTTPTKAE